MSSSSHGSSRHIPFRYFQPAKRRATQYEEVTLHIQWAPQNYAVQGYFNHDIHDRPPWHESSTRLRAKDWWAYRDPGQDWFRPFNDRQAAIENAIELSLAGATRSGLFDEMKPEWVGFLATHYAACRYPAYGLFMSMCYAQREALSDVVSAPMIFSAVEQDRHAQDITLHCLELEKLIPGFSDADSKQLWMESPVWQPTRKVIEKLLASRDWGEINLVVNLLVEPLISALLSKELVLRFAPFMGDTVTPTIEQGAEADREIRKASTCEFVRFLRAQDAENDTIINEWIAKWFPDVSVAVRAFAPVFAELGAAPQKTEDAFLRLHRDWKALISNLDLKIPAYASAP